MGHHHNGHHHESHEAKELTFTEKAAKLLDHWRRHNEDHAGNYHRWADEFRHHQLSEAATLLESAAELTRQINQILEEATRLVPK